MYRKTGIIFVVIGIVLILSALFLFFYNEYAEYRAGQNAEILMDDIYSALFEQEASSSSTVNEEDVSRNDTFEFEDAEQAETIPTELPKVLIDGYEYIGYISIPALDLNLPVMADWDYTRLKIAPCRHFGSSRTDDLVIAAHNYKTHFKLLSELAIGSEITFTDMDGIVNIYTLSKLEILSPNEVDVVQNSGYDLVLYTCTSGGKTRVAAFCERVTEETNNGE